MAIASYNQSVVLPFGLNPAAISGLDYHNEVVTGFDENIFKYVSITNKEIDRHPQRGQFSFMDLVKYLGFMVPIAAGAEGKYGHWEKDWVRQTLVVGPAGFQGAGGAGVDVTFRLDPATIYTDPQNGTVTSYARKGEQIHFNFGPQIVNAIIKNITTVAGTREITLEVHDSSVDLLSLLGGAGEGAGDEYMLYSSAHGEGTNHGESIQVRNLRYTNQLKIVKDQDRVTGSLLTRGFRLEKVVLDDGKTTIYSLKGSEEAMQRFKYKVDGAILFDTRNDNLFITDADSVPNASYVGRPINTTMGLIPYVQQNGHNLPYTIGSHSIADYDAMDALLDSEAAPKDYLLCVGSAFRREQREVLKDYLGETVSNQYVANSLFGGDLSEDARAALAMAVDFKSVRLSSDRVYHTKTIDSFHDPKGAGAGAYNYNRYFIALPYGTFKNKMSKSDRTSMFGDESMYNSENMPYWGYCYSAARGYNREVEVWQTGAAGGEGKAIQKYTDEFDRLNTAIRGEFGGWQSAGNLAVISDPQ